MALCRGCCIAVTDGEGYHPRGPRIDEGAVLALIGERGDVSAPEAANALGFSSAAIGARLARMKARGAVGAFEANRRGRLRYCLPCVKSGVGSGSG